MKTLKMIVFAALALLLAFNISTAAAEQHGGLREAAIPSAKPAGIDLDVIYISRTPLYNPYEVLYTAQGTPYLQPGTENNKRWPAPGETVTFTAHIVNKGTTASGTFNFQWEIDGTTKAYGSHASLAPGQEGTESFQWVWQHTLPGECLQGAHTVEFIADPANMVSETYESNNHLRDRTDALSLIIALSPSAYAAFEVPVDPQWPYSAEDWLQKQVSAMNAAFERSVGGYAPNGILERVRIDKIIVGNSSPARGNEDGAWYIDSDVRQTGGYYYAPTDVDSGLLHELTHQLGIMDMYNMDVSLEIPQVLDQLGQPVQMEYSSATTFSGLMNDTGSQPPAYDQHTTQALNANKGCRRGYYGEYLYDMPEQIYLKIYNWFEEPAAGVTVKLYQRSSGPGLYGSWFGTIDNTPEFTGVTDAGGLVLLDNRLAPRVITNTGHTLKDNPFGPIDVVGRNNQFILEMSRNGHQEFAWLDITDFNLAYWRGEKQSATVPVFARIPIDDAPAAPLHLTGVQEYGQVNLQWTASPSAGVAGYNIYRTDNTKSPYQRIVTQTGSLTYSEPYNASRPAATYVVTAMYASGRESAFSNPFYAFRLSRPMGVVVDDQNGRIVLDPQNGYGLYYQLADGTLFDTRGSVDYHLEYSEYIARDSAGRLILSHPGDFYTSRHTVRVADANAMPLFEFGSQGSGPGQFETPAGVATWGQTCGITGPYAVDASTLLLLHLNNSIDGEQGEFGTSRGVTFTEGKYDKGITVDSADTLVYPSSGNINRTQGAVEFWIRPHWYGGDGQSYTFFEVGNVWFNRMRIMKDGANNLRFMVWDSDTEYGVAYNVGDWQAEEWHHVAASWSGTTLSMYVDGQKRASTDSASPPDTLGQSLYIGSSSAQNQQAHADLDEFRISSIPRLGNSDTCSYRILVADSGNNRIQAFDGDGNFIATFGSFGSETGSFNSPEGLAVDGNGNVIVADGGNNRLQVLSFDGSHFGFIRSISANLSDPTGIATYGTNRILVADTGHHKVKVLNGQGTLLAEYSAPNDGHTGVFNDPHGVAADQHGTIIVADTGNKRIVSILGALELQVLSIKRTDPNPTNSATVHFTVKFSSAVTGVDASDFALTTTGVANAVITEVSGSGDTYTVTVNTGTGRGTIRLDLVDDNTILDVEGNPLGGPEIGDGSFISGESYTINKDTVFSDVPVSHPYHQDIMILYANGLTAGCQASPLKFCPDQIMNRAQAAVFMLRGNFGTSYVPPVPQHLFQDDWTKGPWAEGWAEGMLQEGFSAGCLASPLKYCPWDQIPREQAVIFALKLKYGKDYVAPPATGTIFADMANPSYYATAWAEQAYQEGIIQNCGMSAGKPKFCPRTMVTRGLAAYMIVRAKNLTMP